MRLIRFSLTAGLPLSILLIFSPIRVWGRAFPESSSSPAHSESSSSSAPTISDSSNLSVSSAASQTSSTPSTNLQNLNSSGAFGGLTIPSTSSSSYTASTSSSPLPGLTPLPQEHNYHLAKIVKVKVVGNKNIRERVVLSMAKTKKNDIYNPEALRKDVQAIYASGDFDDVNVDVSDAPGGIVVTFQVTEKPMIKRIDFKGNKKISTSKLRDTTTLKENDSLDKLKLSMDVDKLANLYKDEGFAAAQIEPFTTSDPTNHVIVTFYITEGTQVLVDAVNVEGVHAFKPKKIKKLMKTRHKKVFKQETLTSDLDDITKFYKNHGYQNVKIGDVQKIFNTDKTRITLTVPIDEGPLIHFGTTTFSGNAIFLNQKLTPALQYKRGDIFSQEKLDETVAKLQDIYGAQGYIRVQIKPTFQQDLIQNVSNVEFDINEGEIVYVDHIAIEGNTHTKEYVIRREIKLKEGDPFSSVLARKSVERLYNLGFLDNVDIDVQQPNSPNKADVIFTVTEGKPGMLSAGAGYSSVDKLIGTFQLQHTNFLGRGERLSLQWQIGGRLNSLDVGWTEPWFLGKPVSVGIDLYNIARIQQYGTDINAYTTRDRGGSLTVGPRFSDIYSLPITYSYTNDLRYALDPNGPPGLEFAVLGTSDPNVTEANFLYSNFTEQLIRDTRDNQFDPTHGMKTSLGITEGGLFPANAVKFYKPVIDESIHIPTFWKFVLSLHGEWAEIKPYGTSSVSDIVNQLFYVGGADTVRGYQLGHVGNLNGSQVMNVYNVEYKFPIAPDEHGRTLLQGVFFYDIGGGWNSIREISYKVSNTGLGLQQGVGFGVRFKTPVFPLRLDWGYGLNPQPGDKPAQFYFSVGSLF